MTWSFGFGRVGGHSEPHSMLACHAVTSVQYSGKNLRAWWRKNESMTANQMLLDAEKDYARLLKKCDEFDAKLYADAKKSGGETYAQLCAMAYRQAVAAH